MRKTASWTASGTRCGCWPSTWKLTSRPLLRARSTSVSIAARSGRGSSGAVPPFDPTLLAQKGSLFLTRPSLQHYIATGPELAARAEAVFTMIRKGTLKLRIEHTYSLGDARQAHRDLEGRKTTGKLLLLP